MQTNAEHHCIDYIQSLASTNTNGIIINAAAWTHTSIALRDALIGVAIPFIEVHISNVHARESFRHQSLLCDAAWGVIQGFGVYSYHLALAAFINQLNTR